MRQRQVQTRILLGYSLGLAPAHTGYMYQDLVTAYLIAQGIIDKFDLRVDKKQFEGTYSMTFIISDAAGYSSNRA